MTRTKATISKTKAKANFTLFQGFLGYIKVTTRQTYLDWTAG